LLDLAAACSSLTRRDGDPAHGLDRSGTYREQALRDKTIYEDRLEAMAQERDARATEALAAQERFAAALTQVSAMQSQILATEERRREFETGLEVVHATLRRTIGEREVAKDRLAALAAQADAAPVVDAESMAETLDFVTRALAETAGERDRVAADAQVAVQLAGDLDLELRLIEERNDEIFQQLEAALQISVEPLDNMFRTAGLDAEALIEDVREGYGGRAARSPPSVLHQGRRRRRHGPRQRHPGQLDRLNMYRIAVEQVPFSIAGARRLPLDLGLRAALGPDAEGVDLAGPIGTPIHAIRRRRRDTSRAGLGLRAPHQDPPRIGIETRYGHLNAIRVEVGQRVSRGDRIGDMGKLGRSTGPHLHYEIRVGGEPLNPMIYIGAGDDVL
jgi:murein DD-endopeptidase MepM/ murein hydrolase activator NlpD